jgi:septal ring factor EnvC (AmiA/AmiB activator)
MGIGSLAALAAVAAFGAPDPNVELRTVRGEINSIERDLIETRESQANAGIQLKKIRRLLALQQKEIQLSRARVDQLEAGMKDLAARKQELLDSIERQKIALRLKLRELHRLTEMTPLDATWLADLEAQNQKAYFLAKNLRKDLSSVERLKADVQEALALELRILDEKNKLDYYVNELSDQATLLSANEEVQKEILRTNRTSRLDALRRMRSLRESERELDLMLGALRDAGGRVDAGLAAMKGKLPAPLDGPVLSTFGKSFNSKTNLLTFQKGITLGTKPSADVRAVSSGKVAFAGPLKSYGLIVIVEHPGQFYTLYGQLGAVDVEEGALVRQGDALGKTSSEPLYFEIRDKNVAINPLQWLANGSITLSRK